MEITLNEEQLEMLVQQWAEVVPEGQDYRPTFLSGYKDLTVEQILLHITGENRKVSDEQVANLAVIMSGEVGVDLSSRELKAKIGSDGEKLLKILSQMDRKILRIVFPLLGAFLVALHKYLYREAKQDRNVVRALIFVP